MLRAVRHCRSLNLCALSKPLQTKPLTKPSRQAESCEALLLLLALVDLNDDEVTKPLSEIHVIALPKPAAAVGTRGLER
jgi:hypothetical protein